MKFHILQVAALLTVGGFLGYNAADAARILSIFPLPAKSHWFAIKPLFVELSKRGHNITLITCFPEEDFPPEWEVIVIPAVMPKSVGRMTAERMTQMTAVDMYNMVLDFGLEICEMAFAQEPIKALMNESPGRFDLLVLEYFNHNCLLAVAHRLAVPVVGYSSFGGFSWTTDAVGDPYPLAYIPDAMLALTDRMTFWQRLTNAFTVSYARLLYHYHHLPRADALVQRLFPDPARPSIAALEANTSLVIVQTHVSFSYPRPHLPNVIETGGMHTQVVKPLPEDLQKLLDGAKDGVIFFSMGSFLRSDDLPAEKVQAFLRVFSKLKQLVLWKWDSENLPGKPPNVITNKWFPQSDLLAHKNVRLFISHCGLQSTLEATSHGVPLIGMPGMSEQKHNAERAAAAGYAVRLDISNVSERSVEWAVREVLDNPRYREKALEKSRLFHDRPQSGVQTAAYWTEYVIRHGGAPHLRSAALHLAWYQYLLLDVAAFVLLCAGAVALTAYLVVRRLYSVLMGQKPPAPTTRNKKKATKKD